MIIIDTPFEGVQILKPKLHTDERGHFTELFNLSTIQMPIAQISRSRSKKNVFRGMHIQLEPRMSKVMQVVNGEAYVYLLDLKVKSPTYGKTFSIRLDSVEVKLITVPWWVAVGFYTTQEYTEMQYLHSSMNNGYSSFAIKYDDPELSISLPTTNLSDPILSKRDSNAMTFAQWKEIVKNQPHFGEEHVDTDWDSIGAFASGDVSSVSIGVRRHGS